MHDRVRMARPVRAYARERRGIDRLALLERVYETDADVDSNSVEVIIGQLRK